MIQMGNYLVFPFLGDMKGIRNLVGGVFKNTFDNTFLSNSIKNKALTNTKS